MSFSFQPNAFEFSDPLMIIDNFLEKLTLKMIKHGLTEYSGSLVDQPRSTSD